MRAPLRVRIAAWFVALLALIIIALSAFLIVELRTDLVGAIDDALRPAAGQIRQDVSVDGVGEFGDSARTVLKGERPAAQLVTPDGVILASFGDPIAQRPMGSRADLAAALRGRRPVGTRTLGAGHDDFRVTWVGVVSHGRRYVIVAAQSSESVDRSVGHLVRLLVLGGAAALLVSAVAGWWLARRALRPMQLITNAAEAIGVDRLSDRVPPGRSHDEVAHLANTINTMLDRIQHGVLAQQRLVADTSHELRTPLAAMRSELDVSLRADDLSPAAREVLLSAREEVDGLSRTIDDLLTLAAGDDSPSAASTATTDLAGLAQTAADALATIARQHGVTVQHDGSPVTVCADPVRLGHAIRNVVENAITFSPRGGTVGITTSVHSEFGRLAIGDEGPGIPVELRERIFDRFFRVDPSRSRATGGSGLGLAITRQIIEAHGGRIRVESAGRGTVFLIDLPSVDAVAVLADTRSPLYARLRGVGTMHARVAFYKLRTGSFEQVVRAVEAPGGLLEIFRGRPGFQSYELVETGAGLFSVSHWESSEQADAATQAAAAWVAGHIDDLVKLQQTDIGEVVLSSRAAAPTR